MIDAMYVHVSVHVHVRLCDFPWFRSAPRGWRALKGVMPKRRLSLSPSRPTSKY